MTAADLSLLVGPALASALATKGYDTLTTVQEAVLDEALEGRDLRITSQTGSGKTIAIGFAVRDLLDDLTVQYGGPARPRVLILAPTRELAKQVSDELTWLFEPLRVRVAAVTGGAAYIDQKRALSSNPAVVVATPGRLRDALERGRIDATQLAAVVLDEADSMLDLGFREDLDAILALLPAERRSHLVSATFSRDVVSLADRFQKDPVHVQGTKLGDANSDIEHVIHLVEPRQRVDALINLLLSDEDAKSLVFARTRADVARIAGELAEAGFVVRTLSGEMDQPERDRALAAFRQGGVQALVATDVAARGIDVRDVARVIQVEPPTDVETYTHRSGRTGRAGKQGTSVLFVAPSHYQTIARGLSRAKIAHKVEPIPRPDAIQRAREEKLVAWLARDGDGETIDPHAVSIAEQIVAGNAVVSSVARLIEKAGLHGPTRARDVRSLPAPRDDRMAPPARGRDSRGRPMSGDTGPRREGRGPGGNATTDPSGWVTFRVTWGGLQGADARRLLAIACRRGEIRGAEVGAIRIEANHSLIDVARPVADRFEASAGKPDPRNPRMDIVRSGGGAPPSGRPASPAPRYGAPSEAPPPRSPERPSRPRPDRPSRPRAEVAPSIDAPAPPPADAPPPSPRHDGPRPRHEGPRSRPEGPPRSYGARPRNDGPPRPRGRDDGPPRPRGRDDGPPRPRGRDDGPPRPRSDGPPRARTDGPRPRPRPEGAPRPRVVEGGAPLRRRK